MKKTLIFTILAVIILGFGLWYFLFPSSSAPVRNAINSVLPFGSGDNAPSGNNPTPPNINNNSSTTTPGSAGALPHFFKISDVPIAGAAALMKNGSLVVRYVERATGHIYDINPATLEKVEIINTTVPKVYSAIWKSDGSKVIFQTLSANDSVESVSYALTAPKSTSTPFFSATSTSLRSDISALSTGINNLFFTEKNSTSIFSSGFDGSHTTSIFSGAFNEWSLSPAGDNNLVITTAPGDGVAGYAYSVNVKTGTLTKLLGPLDALIVNSNPTFTHLAFADKESGIMQFYTKNLGNGVVSTILPTTFPEKCVWSRKNTGFLYCGAPSGSLNLHEPDMWYQGRTHYSDSFWFFNTDTEYTGEIVDPKKDYGVDIDAINLFLSPNEDYLFITNKTDLTLWALKLE